MGYNLRREFLIANQETVHRLIEMAEQEEWVSTDYPDPESAGRAQFHINNILSTLAKWEPTRGWVRRKVRTRLEWSNDGKVQLWVGVPPFGLKLRGSPPISVVLQSAEPDTRITIESPLTPESFATSWLKVMQAANEPSVREIGFTRPPDEAGVRWITENLARQGFELATEKPILTYKRKAA